ncbi:MULTISPECIES: aminotransferase class V-fold PLP-dependent enzyme [Streptomyces]|uniref:Aminotransferase class V-fold PLP-dependent enzyme n=1 Tax=Streptomyces parvus TaxID=66428 RepID=A0A5D4JKN8_9ACTN|nr:MULTISPECIES: aminotransferase class V-fold PLP-dependent enzyme [Streptomyces]PVC98811.1 aminotransferase [Streptomyces sp. CS014]TYR65718.1 aminotransferase class V-fold PLP-dependent enzyme [Streptomyces parvus]
MDVSLLRKRTPGCAESAYFDNAGSALPADRVTQTVIDHLLLEQRVGGYVAADLAAARLDAVYSSVASLINAEPHEIALVENATRAWDMAFYAIPFKPGDRILTSRSEYPSNALAFLQARERFGVKVEPVPDDENGQLCLDALAERLGQGGVRLVAVNHAPTYDGLVNPAAEIGELAARADALYLLDACQSVGQLPIDVKRIGCHLLSATGRKYLRGPRGTGFLYVDEDVVGRLDPPFLDLRAGTWTGPASFEIKADAKRFETWERNVAGLLGLGAAVDDVLDIGIEAIRKRIAQLADDLRAGLSRVSGVTVCDRGVVRSGIVTFSKDGLSAGDIVAGLRAAGVTTAVSLPSRAQFDTRADKPPVVVRASVHYYNTPAEQERLISAVAGL